MPLAASIGSSAWSLGAFDVAQSGGVWRVSNHTSNQTIWSTVPGSPILRAAQSHDRVVGSSGCWVITRRDANECSSLAPDAVHQPTEDSLTLLGAFGPPCNSTRWNLTFEVDASRAALRFDAALVDAEGGYDRLSLTYARSAGERFFGFGQQYTASDAAGSLVPIFTREQGIGRGLEPITATLNAAGRNAGGDNRTTYSAMPHYLTSHLRSLHLLTAEPSQFDLRRAGAVEIEISASAMSGRIFGGESALGLLTRATEYLGRMRPLPSWIHSGAVVGIQGGTRRVDGKVRSMLAAGVPLAGVWMQDWAGAHEQDILGMRQMRLRWNWRLDTALYPEWPHLVANLSSRGVRVLT
jgi:alpha-glucosidase